MVRTLASVKTSGRFARGGAVVASRCRQLTPSLARSAHGGLPLPSRVEQRRLIRLACRVRRLDRVGLVGDRTIDLSPEGMLLLSDEELALGTELTVSFVATDLPIWFDTRARVARVVEGRRPHDVGRALGLRFDSLPAVSRLILRGHLRTLPLAKPQRALPPHLAPVPDPDYARAIRDIAYGPG